MIRQKHAKMLKTSRADKKDAIAAKNMSFN
jgi:hypothetical protein